ncbi:MAG: hypothetical protein AAFR17_04200 [Pseudomonadota bacterium]
MSATLAAAVLAILLVVPQSDPESVFGAAREHAGALEAEEGRSLVIALTGGAGADRAAAASAISAQLSANPMIATVRIGAPHADAALIDWLWQHRFRLSPPRPEDLTAEAMAATLRAALDQLTTAEGIVLGPYLLDDPTGSLLRLRARLTGLAPRPPAEAEESAAPGAEILFARFTDQTYDPTGTARLAGRLRSIAETHAVRPLLIGPRIIAAEVGQRIERAALTASALAFALLLIWLGVMLRSAGAVLACLLPLAFGVSVAAVTVQLLFGSVHVLALGFGGALTGLALDYPLHLTAHRGARRAGRLILLGAGTTAIAFLALLGAGLPAFAQTGVFVATGLSVAALSSLATPLPGRTPRLPPLDRLIWRLPAKPWVAGAMAAAGLAAAFLVPGPEIDRAFGLPTEVEADIAALRQVIELPSGRAVLTVSGASADETLSRAATLSPLLEAAREAGDITRGPNLAEILPDTARQSPPLPSWPEIAPHMARAVAEAGLALGHLARLEAAWRAAVAAPLVHPQDLAAHPALAPFLRNLTRSGQGWRLQIPLFGLRDFEALHTRISTAAIPGVTLRDRVAELSASVDRLQRRVALWLGVGALAALAFLALAGGSVGRALCIGLVSAGALGLVVAVLILAGGGLGVFQIMALTLVAGIGVDYGLFLERAEDRVTGARSTGLCAASTLIAFGVMAVSPAPVLADIGWTVSLGILAMLGLHLAESGGDRGHDGEDSTGAD